MRDSVAAARRREAQIQRARARYDAAVTLVRQLDNVLLLSEYGRATPNDRQGLAVAIENYDRTTRMVRLTTRK